MPQEKYNAMDDFKRKSIEYLFKQPPVAVLAILFLGLVISFAAIMWKKIERTQDSCEAKIEKVNHEWAVALNENNLSLQRCMSQKDTLFQMYARVNAKVSVLESQLKRVERGSKN